MARRPFLPCPRHSPGLADVVLNAWRTHMELICLRAHSNVMAGNAEQPTAKAGGQRLLFQSSANYRRRQLTSRIVRGSSRSRGAVAGSCKVPNKSQPGVKARREIRRYQQTADLLTQKCPFQKLACGISLDLKEISQECMPNGRSEGICRRQSCSSRSAHSRNLRAVYRWISKSGFSLNQMPSRLDMSSVKGITSKG